ncbi:MAG TPA: L-dopachrome tautomerase-related protein [Herpetosiphonaceae bacterium]|nr:L-dopachrome tautomerase-related protein [Herpetosiphonaceae bacterium]
MRRLRRILGITVAVLLLAVIILLAVVKITLGSGEPYPDVSTAPLFPAALEVAAELPLPPGNIAVSADGRIFFNYHYLGGKDLNGNSVFELIDGKPAPYPSAAFQPTFKTTLGMLIDAQNRLWVVDPAGLDGDRQSRLLAFDLTTNEVAYDYTFANDDADFAQDLQVSSDGRMIYLASTGVFGAIPANLVVLDTQTGTARTLLRGHASVEPQDWRIRTGDGEHVSIAYGLIDWQIGVDGIALTKDDAWLYYGAISHDTLYRISTARLLDARLSDEQLAQHIEAVGRKPLSDGFSADLEGNIYITDIEHGGIARMTPDGRLETLIKDPRVRWADGISFAPERTIYFSDSAIPAYLTQTADPASPEAIQQHGPYYLFKFTTDKAGVPGS